LVDPAPDALGLIVWVSAVVGVQSVVWSVRVSPSGFVSPWDASITVNGLLLVSSVVHAVVAAVAHFRDWRAEAVVAFVSPAPDTSGLIVWVSAVVSVKSMVWSVTVSPSRFVSPVHAHFSGIVHILISSVVLAVSSRVAIFRLEFLAELVSVLVGPAPDTVGLVVWVSAVVGVKTVAWSVRVSPSGFIGPSHASFTAHGSSLVSSVVLAVGGMVAVFSNSKWLAEFVSVLVGPAPDTVGLVVWVSAVVGVKALAWSVRVSPSRFVRPVDAHRSINGGGLDSSVTIALGS
jgi:xanthosine utilization system XapX-like protein